MHLPHQFGIHVLNNHFRGRWQWVCVVSIEMDLTLFTKSIRVPFVSFCICQGHYHDIISSNMTLHLFFCPDIMKLKTLKGLALQDILTQIHTYVHRGSLLALCFQYCNHPLFILYFLCSGFSSQGQNDFAGEDGECGVSWRLVVTSLAATSSSLQLVQRTGNKSWVLCCWKTACIRPQKYTILKLSSILSLM